MFFNLLKRRRSIRRFKNRKIEKDKITLLLKSALLAPSSRSIRPWEFILVEDKETLKKLADSKPHGAAFLAEAAIGIAVIADREKSDVWVEDTSIASVILLLTAEDLGLGACWIQIRKRNYDDNLMASDYVKKTLKIPDKYEVESIIAIGCPDEAKRAYEDSDLLMGKLHKGRFGERFREILS